MSLVGLIAITIRGLGLHYHFPIRHRALEVLVTFSFSNFNYITSRSRPSEGKRVSTSLTTHLHLTGVFFAARSATSPRISDPLVNISATMASSRLYSFSAILMALSSLSRVFFSSCSRSILSPRLRFELWAFWRFMAGWFMFSWPRRLESPTFRFVSLIR